RLRAFDDTESKFFTRFVVQDVPGVLEKISHVLGESGISVLKLLQKDTQDHQAEIVMVTHKVTEQEMAAAMDALQQVPEIIGTPTLIRVGLDEFHPKGLLEK
ncbi:hypothetical protein DID77_04415, partial [Candidatus Marinamargulisbacteria bacterium SCGC AG-439-L15]